MLLLLKAPPLVVCSRAIVDHVVPESVYKCLNKAFGSIAVHFVVHVISLVHILREIFTLLDTFNCFDL